MAISRLATPYQFENFGAIRWNSRGGTKITTIVIHHMATTNFNSVPGIWANREASAHYGIGPNGEIRAYVDEEKRAWHCGDGNSYSIGIENCNISTGPDWKVSDKTVDSLVALIKEIQSRRGKLKIEAHCDVPGNATACCGPCLYPRLQEIRSRVNEFNTAPTTPEKPIIAPQNKPKFKVGDKVVLIAGAKNWNSYRGEPITPKFSVEDMVIPFEIKSVSTGNLTYKIARQDYQEINGWVDERHIAIAPTNDIKPMDKITLRRQASNWVGGDKINETDKTENGKPRVFAVKERKENRLLIYINGWERWAFDWDCVPFK